MADQTGSQSVPKYVNAGLIGTAPGMKDAPTVPSSPVKNTVLLLFSLGGATLGFMALP